MSKKGKRNPASEFFSKKWLAMVLEKSLGKYEFNGEIEISFSEKDKIIICPYAKFSEQYNKWFWGIPERYWKDWKDNFILTLVVQNEIQGFSFIPLGPKKARLLLKRCSPNKESKQKIINLRINEEGKKYFQAFPTLMDVEKRIRPLDIDFEKLLG